jgi:UPF0716 family protein affecting phage T7 exclusion
MVTEESKKCKKVTPQTFQNSTKKLLWFILIIILAICVFAEIFIPPHKAHFEIEKITGFYSIFGFLACVAIIFISKFLGIFLKRDEDYYD